MAIATKQQERDTLNKIVAMVKQLGEGSYVATAFKGCFEDAETNIEYDFGDNYKDRYDHLQEQHAMLKAELTRKDEKLVLQEATMRTLEQKLSELEKVNLDLNDGIYNNCVEFQTYKKQAESDIGSLEHTVKAQAAEILQLKAKLYDMLVEGGKI